MRLDRRTLLVGGGAAVGLTVAYAMWPRAAAPMLRAARGEALLGPGILIGNDGRVTVAIPQVETGQGIWTGLAQVAADELGAAWETVGVAPSLPSAAWNNSLAEDEGWLDGLGSWRRWSLADEALQITAGSTSMRAMYAPMQRLGGAARILLIAEAAERWGVAAAECETSDGFVRHEGKSLPFADLAEAAAGRSASTELSPRTTRGKLIGQPLPRLDALPKAKGEARFAGDVRLPAMLFAAVRMHGGELAAPLPSAPQGVTFARGQSWTAAIAKDWWSAEQALESAAIRSRTLAGGDDDAVEAALLSAMSDGVARSLHRIGDIEDAFDGVRPLVADYRASAALHLDLEPPSATARLADGLLELWVPTQAPEQTRQEAARAAGIGLAETILYPMPVGGQGGRGLESELVAVAVKVARQTGRPVQVTMSRAEQVRTDPVRPPLAARMMARLLPDGRIAGWRMRVAGGDGTVAAMNRLFAGEGAAFRTKALGPLPYNVPHVQVEAVDAEMPLRLGYHRGELLAPATFFIEGFIDELARIGGRDPLGMRVALLAGNARLARCLVRATTLGGWDGGGPGSSMGLAVLSAYGSHVALVLSAALGSQGQVTVSRMVACVDCGQAINPGLVRQQVEGGLLAGLAQATAPAPNFRLGRVLGPTDVLAPALAATPEILVEVLPSRAPPGGVNGLGPAVVAAAVGNALAAATGRRLRALPFDPMS